MINIIKSLKLLFKSCFQLRITYHCIVIDNCLTLIIVIPYYIKHHQQWGNIKRLT